MPQWWPFHKETRTALSADAADKWGRLSQPARIVLAGALLALGLWAALALQLPGSNSVLEPGRPSPDTFQAPTGAEFVSDLQTAEAQALAENDPANLVYDTDPSLPWQQRTQLRSLLTTIDNIRSDPSLTAPERREELTSFPSASLVISDTLATAILSLDESDWNAVRDQSLSFYDRALADNRYSIDAESIEDLRERIIPFWANSLPKIQRDLVVLFTSSFLRVNHTLDAEATAERKREARAAVEPVVITVQPGQTIVRDGEIVRPEMIEMLEATGGLPRRLSGLDMAGFGLISVLLSAVTMIYMIFLQPNTVRQTRALFVIVGLLVLMAVAARLAIPRWPDYTYAFPMATIVLVLAVVFNSHLALACATLLAIVTGLLADESLPLALTMLVGSVAGIFSVRGAERPLTFLLAGLSIALATAVSEVGFWLIASVDVSWAGVSTIALFSGANGMLSSILALGLFNVVGHLAGVVTPLQLMELAHPSQPLLKKLMREAPGTYSHSVSVGNLAESAAEAVGADALLLRVAAYYHDIGKTIRPYFFTDNQTGRENVHNDLDPQTSAAIIIDHVREGIKMGEAARLPQPIIDFIATHHGTHTVSHFYQLALREQDTVDIEDFRYPGPRPFTREQGIMMLADSVEATVRAKAQHGQIISQSMRESSSNGQLGGAQTLEELVRSIMDERVRSGQLDNTHLTLRDLVLIRAAFISSLQGIYHPRVEYAPQMVKA